MAASQGHEFLRGRCVIEKQEEGKGDGGAFSAEHLLFGGLLAFV